jgi:hypothetical protein
MDFSDPASTYTSLLSLALVGQALLYISLACCGVPALALAALTAALWMRRRTEALDVVSVPAPAAMEKTHDDV